MAVSLSGRTGSCGVLVDSWVATSGWRCPEGSSEGRYEAGDEESDGSEEISGP